MTNNIIITGMPGSGKSTLLREIISTIPKKVGFVTNEVLGSDGKRTGFEIETNNSNHAILASTNLYQTAQFKVSRYGVSLQGLETIMPQVSEFSKEDLLYLDEIGQMQLYSGQFNKFVTNYLDSANICLATLTKAYDSEFIKSIKSRQDSFIFEITLENRELRQKQISAFLQKIKKASKYVSQPERFGVYQGIWYIQSDHGIEQLTQTENGWICDCDFYAEHKICSHEMALVQVLKSQIPNQ